MVVCLRFSQNMQLNAVQNKQIVLLFYIVYTQWIFYIQCSDAKKEIRIVN